MQVDSRSVPSSRPAPHSGNSVCTPLNPWLAARTHPLRNTQVSLFRFASSRYTSKGSGYGASFGTKPAWRDWALTGLLAGPQRSSLSRGFGARAAFLTGFPSEAIVRLNSPYFVRVYVVGHCTPVHLGKRLLKCNSLRVSCS